MGGGGAAILLGVAAAAVAPLPSFALACPRSPALVHPLPFAHSRPPALVHVHPPSLVPPLVCTPLIRCPPSFVPAIVRTSLLVRTSLVPNLPPLFLPRPYPPTLVRHRPPLFVQRTRSFVLALGCVWPSRLLLTLVLWTHPCSCSLLLMVPVQVTSTCCKSIISILILISMLTFLCFPLALWVNNA
jgi:hypothetical protein